MMTIALAPMAGVTDLAFRMLCREQGATYTVTEMVSAKALCYQDGKSLRLLALGRNEHPAAVQLFGSDPACMAEAAAKAAALSKADAIDVNMGCPTPKIVNNGDGCALMKNPALAGEIVARMVKAAPVPVTVKMRLGWDRGSVNCVEFAKTVEAAGAARIAVHGRTRSMQYSGVADHNAIRAVKTAVGIPVWANGDIASGQAALRALSASGADGVMVGRGALGDPWVFAEISAVLRGLPPPPPPTVGQRCDAMGRQLETSLAYFNERVAVLEARKYFHWYLRGLPHMQPYKQQINTMQTMEDAQTIVSRILHSSRG